tara:strand:+ start:1471 stop:1779 length:309 start_codon:yes stop_codon:yes gene_type:complete
MFTEKTFLLTSQDIYESKKINFLTVGFLVCKVFFMSIIHIHYYDSLQGKSFALESESVKQAKDIIRDIFIDSGQKPFLVKAPKLSMEKSISNYAIQLFRSIK